MRILKLFLQYTAVIFITLLGVEVALRIFASFPTDAANYIYDEHIGYRARPNMPINHGLTTNNFGFNDIDHAVEPKTGSSRVAIVGDSFVFGEVARNNNFTFVLQDIAKQEGVDLEVMNMGIAAAGPKNYLALVKNDVAASNAKLVVVCVFIGNDITQSHPDFKTSVWLNATRETLVKPYSVGASWEYSYIYRTIRSLRRVVRERLDKTPRESFTRENFMEIEWQRALIYKKDMSGFIRDSFDGTIHILEEMSQEVKRQNKQFLVIMAPDEVQISSDIQHYLKTHYQLDTRENDFGQPQAILNQELKNRGIAVLDLLPFFQNAKGNDDLYKQYNTHWNDDGNRVAAEAIWHYLSENILGGL